MRAPLVTVGIPFFNEAHVLASAIRSILGQTHRDLELLLVDDGSSDGSVEVARSFSDPRVVVHADGVRSNLATRLNEITRRARGRFIARMDADDVAHPTRLARQLTRLEDPAFAGSGTWTCLVNEGEEPLAVVETPDGPLGPRRVLESGILAHATLVARREWFEAHPYDVTLSRTEDRDLWCRTAATTRFAIVPAPLYVLRIQSHEQGFISTYVETQRQNRALFLRYGPSMVGWPATLALWSRAHAKSLTVRAADRLSLLDRLVRRRGRPPTMRERALVAEALAAARSQGTTTSGQ